MLTRSICPGKASIVRTKTSRSSGPASTAKGEFSTMALGIVRRSGDVPTSRRCGWTWYAGPWEIFPAMPLPDPRRQDNVLGAPQIVWDTLVRTRSVGIRRSNLLYIQSATEDLLFGAIRL